MADAGMDSVGPTGLNDKMYRSGLIGRSILASRSPWLHEQEARAQGLSLDYELFDFSERGLDDAALGPLLRQLAAAGYCGLNITFPFKQAVIPLLDELAESAAMVEAVNTVAMHNGRLVGHNTDMIGFRNSLLEGLPDRPLRQVLQLGAGGAGSAVAIALLSLDTERLVIADIDRRRSEALATKLANRFGRDRVTACDIAQLDTAQVDGIVNTTPMGMAANPRSAIAPEYILARHWVADIVYFPLETELLRIARERGCRVLDGSGMVISQAAEAFEIFTGSPANRQRMRQSFFDN